MRRRIKQEVIMPDSAWKREFKSLYEQVEPMARDHAWDPKWIKRIYSATKLGIKTDEKDDVIDLSERIIAYARKALIDHRMHDDARRLYIHQMRFRGWLRWQQKRYLDWFMNFAYWVGAGYRRSYFGLVRFFFIIVFSVILVFALLYACPFPRIEYVSSPKQQLCMMDYFYFSGMTFTAFGYGDMAPKSGDKLTLFLTVFEALTGYVLLAVLISFIIEIEKAVPPPTGHDLKDLALRLQ